MSGGGNWYLEEQVRELVLVEGVGHMQSPLVEEPGPGRQERVAGAVPFGDIA